MATKASVASKTATSKKDAEEDLAILIYRDSQLREARNSCRCCKELGTEAIIICFNSTNYNSEKICCCG
jgi:hypothetical protein